MIDAPGLPSHLRHFPIPVLAAQAAIHDKFPKLDLPDKRAIAATSNIQTYA